IPTRAACGRAARNRSGASSSGAPNLPDRSWTAPPLGKASRKNNPNTGGSPTNPTGTVSCRIFASSSALSKAKSVTPWTSSAARRRQSPPDAGTATDRSAASGRQPHRSRGKQHAPAGGQREDGLAPSHDPPKPGGDIPLRAPGAPEAE